MTNPSDPFVVLNRIVAQTFGSRTPITYYPRSGALTAGTSFTVEAILENPHDLEQVQQGVMLQVWLDGNDPVLIIPPQRGDRFQIPNGNVYTVNLVETDAENGIVLSSRQQL
jgi:hypothetical protein